MDSPWKTDDPAFDPMYDEPVVIRHAEGGETEERTVACAVISSATGDPLSPEAIDTDREDIAIACRRQDWPFVRSLKRGDEVARTATNGKRYKVAEAKYDSVMGWTIAARSI